MNGVNLSRLIQIEASKQGHRLFINARGQGWVGRLKSMVGGVATIVGARKVTFGVGPDGASDLIGWTRDGRFAAIEVKAGADQVREGQQAFCDAAVAAGGRAGIVRSVEEAMIILGAV